MVQFDQDYTRARQAEVTVLRADALHLATLVNSYAGNLEILREMQELSRRVLALLRKIECSLSEQTTLERSSNKPKTGDNA